MKYSFLTLCLCLFVSVAAPATAETDFSTVESVVKTAPSVSFEKEIISILKDNGERLQFEIELALSPAQQTQGLMFRREMAENAGMLFLFNSNSKRSFWMKNTLIPLDILFLHPDGTIHHIHHNSKPQDLTAITSYYPAKAVLELNGGAADSMGIKEGDKVLHPVFKNLNVQR